MISKSLLDKDTQNLPKVKSQSFFTFSYPYNMVEKALFWGQIFKIEILMN